MKKPAPFHPFLRTQRALQASTVTDDIWSFPVLTENLCAVHFGLAMIMGRNLWQIKI